MKIKNNYGLDELEIHELTLEDKIKKMEKNFHHAPVKGKNGEEFCPIDFHLLERIKQERKELSELIFEIKRRYN